MRPLAFCLLLVACDFSRPIENQHPTVQRAPPSADESEPARRDALQRTIAIDFGCGEPVEIVLTLERRYANTAAPRYVVEACGTRALYAETCESWPQCRYVLLSALQLGGAAPAASSLAPAPAAEPIPSALPVPQAPDAGSAKPAFF